MALGTSIFYYREASLATLQAGVPYTDSLTWGQLVRDTTNSEDYWIEPSTGLLIPRKQEAGLSQFNVKDSLSGNVVLESGDNLNFSSTTTITPLVTKTGNDVSVFYTLSGLSTAAVGSALTVSNVNTLAYTNPLTINPSSSSSLSIDANNRLSISSMSIAMPFVSVEVTLANFISLDSQEPQLGVGDIIILSGAGGTYVHNGGTTGSASDYYLMSTPGGGITSFPVQFPNNLDPIIISDNSALKFANGPGIIVENANDEVDIRFSPAMVSLVINQPNNPVAPHIILYTGNTYNYATLSSMIGMTSFNISGDSGGPLPITNGLNLRIFGGLGINSVGLNSGGLNRDITLNLEGNVGSIASALTPTVAGSYILQLNQATGIHSYVEASTVTDTSLGNTDQTLTGTRSVNQAANALMFNATAGSIGFINGTVRVSTGDLETVSATSGLILKAANGSRYRIKISNIGALTSTLV